MTRLRRAALRRILELSEAPAACPADERRLAEIHSLARQLADTERRRIVHACIEQHVEAEELEGLRRAARSEGATLAGIAEQMGGLA